MLVVVVVFETEQSKRHRAWTVRLGQEVPTDTGSGVDLHLQHPVRSGVPTRHDLTDQCHVSRVDHRALFYRSDHDVRNEDPPTLEPHVDPLEHPQPGAVGTSVEQMREAARRVPVAHGRGRAHQETPVEEFDPVGGLAEGEVLILAPRPHMI